MKNIRILDYSYNYVLNNAENYQLTIENVDEFRRILHAFNCELNEKIVLFQEGKIQIIKNQLLYIGDILNFDISGKKFNLELYKNIAKSLSNKNEKHLNLIKENISEILYEVEEDFDEIDYSINIEYEDVFKLVDLEVRINENNLLEKLLHHIKIYNYVYNIELIIIPLLNDYFSGEQINVFLQELKLMEISCIIINRKCNEELVTKNVIIDQDLYEIY